MKNLAATIFSVMFLASPAMACDGCLVIWASPVWGLLLLICGVIGWKITRVFDSFPRRASVLLLSFFAGFFTLTLVGALTDVLIGFFSLGPSTLLTAAIFASRRRTST